MTLRDEIRDQPFVFEHLLDSASGRIRPVAAALAGTFNYVVIAARGTSDNAARYAKYLWGAHNHLEVSLAAPSLYSAYGSPPRLDEALAVGISQSGQSPDLVAVMAEARAQGRPTLAITNDPSSPMAENADHVIDIGAGVENSVAATKTYTAQLLTVALLSQSWSALDEPERASTQAADLAAIPTTATAIIESEAAIASVVEPFKDAHACAVLARGFNRATAFEWALKLQEMTYVLAHPYSTADFRHGPIAVVESGFPVFAVATRGRVGSEIMELLGELRSNRDAATLAITDSPESPADYTIRVPRVPEWVSPITTVVAGQLFSYHLAVARGADPDQPRGLNKVTRTL